MSNEILFPKGDDITTTSLSLEDSFIEVASTDDETLTITRTYNAKQVLKDGAIVWHTPTANEWTVPTEFKALCQALAEIDRGERVNANNGRSGYNAQVGKVALAHVAFEADGTELDDKQLKKQYKAVATFITAIKKTLWSEATSDKFEVDDIKRTSKNGIAAKLRDKDEHKKSVTSDLEKAEAKVEKLKAALAECK